MSASILPRPTTARVLQISPKETLIYDMPRDTWETLRLTMLDWPIFHNRRVKWTVERGIALLGKSFPSIREEITVRRKPTKRTIRGLKGDVWYDECGFRMEGAT